MCRPLLLFFFFFFSSSLLPHSLGFGHKKSLRLIGGLSLSLSSYSTYPYPDMGTSLVRRFFVNGPIFVYRFHRLEHWKFQPKFKWVAEVHLFIQRFAGPVSRIVRLGRSHGLSVTRATEIFNRMNNPRSNLKADVDPVEMLTSVQCPLPPGGQVGH